MTGFLLKGRKLPAVRIYLLCSLATSLLYSMMFTIFNVYLVQQARFDPLQLVLTGTVLELAIFLFEVPTGVVADVYSRRLSIIIGNVLVGLAWLLFGITTAFLPILLSQVLWGVG